AESTRRTATASTPSPDPISARRRFLRLMPTILRPPGPSAFESEAFDERVEALNLFRIARQGTAGIRRGSEGFVPLAQYRIGAHQPQPSVEVGAIAIEALREPGDHPAYHLGTFIGAQLSGSCHLVSTRPARNRGRLSLDPS